MKNQIIFKGVGTALITPFKDGKIDYAALSEIIEWQIACGVDALVVGGTTGEAATLTEEERYSLFAFARERTVGRVPLILGTGTNDTHIALRHTKEASRIGCEGVLAVTPYYNKGTESGIVKHYLHIAEASTAPVLLYNVPSRTGVNLSLSSVKELSRHENIVGIKEASDSQDRLVALRELGDGLSLYAGNDSAIYTVLALGGAGVISVMSNAYPKETVKICRSFFDGDGRTSLSYQLAALPLIRALFAETNPTPIKYAMQRLGLCCGELRLPLDTASEKTRAAVDRAMQDFEEKMRHG